MTTQGETFQDTLKDLDPGEHPYNLHHALERFEREYLCNILVLAGRNIPEASRMLGIDPELLRAKMRKYMIQHYS